MPPKPRPDRPRLADFTALCFDCYGTLIDWEGGIWDALQPLIAANGRTDIRRAQALAAFAELESACQAAAPGAAYPDILARVHDGIAERFRLAAPGGMAAAFGASVPHWPAFADSADALRALKKRFRLVILSNVHAEGFQASCRKLGVVFDAVYTAGEIGSYKPDPRNFNHMLARLHADHGIARGDILLTAQSPFHDHVPARQAGLANAWIDRQGLSEGGDWGATAKVAAMPQVDFLFPTLAAMAAAVEEEA